MFNPRKLTEVIKDTLELFSVLTFETGDQAWAWCENFHPAEIRIMTVAAFREYQPKTHTDAKDIAKVEFIKVFESLHEAAMLQRDRIFAESGNPEHLKQGMLVRIKDHVRYQTLSHGAVINPPIPHQIKGGQVTKIRTIYVEKMEDEHGNPVNEYAIDTALGMFNPDEIELV